MLLPANRNLLRFLHIWSLIFFFIASLSCICIRLTFKRFECIYSTWTWSRSHRQTHVQINQLKWEPLLWIWLINNTSRKKSNWHGIRNQRRRGERESREWHKNKVISQKNNRKKYSLTKTSDSSASTVDEYVYTLDHFYLFCLRIYLYICDQLEVLCGSIFKYPKIVAKISS